jgi:hypothetical protein
VTPRGGSFSTKITAQRKGTNGPISIELLSSDGTPLPSGFKCEQNIIEKGKNETQLKLARPATIPRARVAETGQKQNLINNKTPTPTLPFLRRSRS